MPRGPVKGRRRPDPPSGAAADFLKSFGDCLLFGGVCWFCLGRFLGFEIFKAGWSKIFITFFCLFWFFGFGGFQGRVGYDFC